MNNEKERKTVVDEDDEIVTMTYEDGTTEDFFCIAELDYEGKWYAYLQPVEETDDFAEDEVLIYEIGEDENGDEIFLPVEDDDLLDKLVEELNNSVDEDEEADE
ncbi:MAG: DUF1292 domain-containing protein [Clostridia bacterium]|nr:DUF1292 domain-containing protein [Clostridia bacterium]